MTPIKQSKSPKRSNNLQEALHWIKFMKQDIQKKSMYCMNKNVIKQI